MPSGSHRRYLFSVFCFDSRTGDLFRNGHRLRITHQAQQVLAALLEDAGTVVSREELQHRLWPDGEYLDWDRAITKVIVQLRDNLRDDARDSRFIATVSKRGYRFIAPVSIEPEAPTAESTEPQQELEPASAPIAAEAPQFVSTNEESFAAALSPSDTASQAQPRRLIPWRLAAAAALIVSVGALSTWTALYFAKFSSPGNGSRLQQADEIRLGIPPFEASGENADSVAESFRMDLTSALAELPRVQVRATHSFTAPLRDDQSIRTTAKSLQLDVLLLGKLTLSGNRFVFELEGVRGGDVAHLGSFRYTSSTEELGTIRERVQRDLFARLELAERGGTWRTQSATPNAKAYQTYLQARLDLSGWADAPVRKALEGFQKAIDDDPNFANAYAGLASAYVVLAYHDVAPREASYRKAQEAATKAVQLSPSNAEAHAVLGKVALEQDWNFEVAERELRRATELDPSRAMHHLWLSTVLCDQSRFEDCLHEIDLARAVDPLWAPVYGNEAGAAAYAGYFQRAVQAAEKVTALMPNWPRAYDQRGWTYWYAGRYADAIADWRRMAQMENDTARMQLEEQGLAAFRRGGVSAYAGVRLKAIQSGNAYRHADTDFVPVEWYCIAGDYDKALAEVVTMVARHDPAALGLTVMPALHPLRNEPRFHAALMRVGLTQPEPRPSTQIAGSSTIRRDATHREPTFR